jgi:prephenate dehydrogenase
VSEARVDREPSLRTLAIVGLGLVGGSLAAAASRAWPRLRILGLDRADVVREAARRGWIHTPIASLPEIVDTDLVVLAVPIPQIVSTLAELGRLAPDVPTTDVGSTKRHVMTAASGAGLTQFVGGHPMAGAEGAGLENARADLFSGRPWLIVPPSTGADHVVGLVEALASGVGARPLHTDAETHDRVMAHAVSGATGDRGVQMTGPALAEMTRLAGSPAELWEGIIGSNPDCVAEALDALRGELDALDPRRGGVNALGTAFARAAAFRDGLGKVTP